MKKLLLLFLICGLFISCSRPADKLQEEIVPIGEHYFTQEEVRTMLFTNGILSSFTLTDERYVAPELKWVEGDYSVKLNKFLFDYNLNHWTKESSDCDDFSRAAAVQAAILFHNSKTRPKGVGLLFGEFHYIKPGEGGHAINFAIVKDKDKYKLVFYEPQVKYIVSLTESEKLSCSWGRF